MADQYTWINAYQTGQGMDDPTGNGGNRPAGWVKVSDLPNMAAQVGQNPNYLLSYLGSPPPGAPNPPGPVITYAGMSPAFGGAIFQDQTGNLLNSSGQVVQASPSAVQSDIQGTTEASRQAGASQDPLVELAPYAIAGLGAYGALAGGLVGGATGAEGAISSGFSSGAADAVATGGTMGVDTSVASGISGASGGMAAPSFLSPSTGGLFSATDPNAALGSGLYGGASGTGLTSGSLIPLTGDVTGAASAASIPLGASGMDSYLNNAGVNLANSGGSLVNGLGSAAPVAGLTGTDVPGLSSSTAGTSAVPGLGAAATGAGGLLSGLGSVAGALLPGLAALNYANNQPGFDPSQLNGILGNMQGANTSGALQGVLSNMQGANTSGALQGVLGNIQGANPNANSQGAMSALQSADPTAYLRNTYAQAQGNAPGYVQASINPLLQSQAAGYGQLLQSLGQRGIAGSSFGNTDISNFLNTTGRGISDAGINAEQSALGLQSNIGSNIGQLTNQNLGQQANLAGQMDQNAYNNLGLQAQAAGNIGNLQNTAFSNQANAASNIGSLQNTSLNNQGNLATNIAGLNVAQQNNKNNMIGRALGLFGTGLGGSSSGAASGTNTGGLYGGLSQIGSSLGSLLSSLGITG